MIHFKHFQILLINFFLGVKGRIGIVSLNNGMYSIIEIMKLLKENPINIPKVPPTDPIIPIKSKMK